MIHDNVLERALIYCKPVISLAVGPTIRAAVIENESTTSEQFRFENSAVLWNFIP